MSFSHAAIHEDNLSLLVSNLSREEFLEGCDFPFLIVGHSLDASGRVSLDGDLDTRPSSIGPPNSRRGHAPTDDFAADDPAVRTGQRSGVFPLRKSDRNPYSDRISVGRSRSCDVVLTSSHVSKLHAHFLPTRQGGWELRDADSRNGTFVNGVHVTSGKRVILEPGDQIRFAYVDTHFLDAAHLYDWLQSSYR